MVTFGAAQLARRLGVPFRSGGSLCGSKVADAQAAYQSANTMWPTLMSGVNFCLHAAGWLEGGLASGYEKLIMDAVNALVTQTASIQRAVAVVGGDKIEFEGSDSLDNPDAVFQ